MPQDRDSLQRQSICVILVTYNRARYLGATIESLLRQTVDDFELLISDDCSPDETELVAREYESRDPRVRYRRNSTNLGIARNLNAALTAVRGDLIAITHDGDLYAPTLLADWREALERCPSAAFVFNDYAVVDGEGRRLRVFTAKVPPCMPGSYLIEKHFFPRRFTSPVWGTVMARRSALLGEGGFAERFGPWTDVDMWLRLAETYDVAYVPKALISLPTRDALPHEFSMPEKDERHIVQRIFLDARKRHYENRPLLKAIELTRHRLLVAATRARVAAIRIKHAFLP